jgi:hypothetical protein
MYALVFPALADRAAMQAATRPSSEPSSPTSLRLLPGESVFVFAFFFFFFTVYIDCIDCVSELYVKFPPCTLICFFAGH